MNIRQQLYKKYRIEGLSAYKSAIKAGYSHATAWNAHKNIEKRCGFDELLTKNGMDNDTIMKVMGEGLNATKVISCNVIAPNGEGMKDANSMTKDFIDVPDFGVRHKYLETLLKLKGELQEIINNGKEVKVYIVNKNEPSFYDRKKQSEERVDLTSQARASFSEQK